MVAGIFLISKKKIFLKENHCFLFFTYRAFFNIFKTAAFKVLKLWLERLLKVWGLELKKSEEILREYIFLVNFLILRKINLKN